jgi:hypothetical protein
MSLVEGEEVLIDTAKKRRPLSRAQIFNIIQEDEGWWSGEGDNGAKSGLFPSTYVALIEGDAHGAAPPAEPEPEPEPEPEVAPPP